jgi:hypothetical protein
MHCFKDFPLSKIVEHSRKCRGDMLGSRERFKNFLPSVHDVGPLYYSTSDVGTYPQVFSFLAFAAGSNVSSCSE